LSLRGGCKYFISVQLLDDDAFKYTVLRSMTFNDGIANLQDTIDGKMTSARSLGNARDVAHCPCHRHIMLLRGMGPSAKIDNCILCCKRTNSVCGLPASLAR
jgi:hypothetical protein